MENTNKLRIKRQKQNLCRGNLTRFTGEFDEWKKCLRYKAVSSVQNKLVCVCVRAINSNCYFRLQLCREFRCSVSPAFRGELKPQWESAGKPVSSLQWEREWSRREGRVWQRCRVAHRRMEASRRRERARRQAAGRHRSSVAQRRRVRASRPAGVWGALRREGRSPPGCCQRRAVIWTWTL